MSFINTARNFKKVPKNCFNSQDGWDKPHTRELQLKGIGRIQNLADPLFLKYIKLVIQKILFILLLWFYAVLIFTSKLHDHPSPNKITPPPSNITPYSKRKISDQPHPHFPSKHFCEIFTLPPPPWSFSEGTCPG